MVPALLTLLAGCGRGPAPVAVEPSDLPATARLETWRELALDDTAPRHASDGLGRIALIEGPEGPLQAGSTASFRFRLTVGDAGLRPGGSLQLVTPAFWGWSPPQLADAEAPGFVVVHGAPEVEADVIPPAIVRLRAPSGLPPGAAVELTYGAGPAAARVDRFAERAPAFWLGVDGDGDGVRALAPDPVDVQTVAGPATGFVVSLPSTARPGDTVRLTVAALDRAGNAARWDGAPVAVEGGGLALAPVLALGPEGRATAEVVPTGAGLHRVAVVTPLGRFVSNPLVVHPEAVRQAWADLQVHTAGSDGTGALDDVYAYARDVAGLDAVAVTDHDHFGLRFLDRHPEDWRAQVDAAERWHAPGRFVTFPAYEWTSWLYGHRHVLYVGAPGPVFGSLDPATRGPDGLWQALASYDALTIPHHVAGGPVALDGRFVGPEDLEPVVEITSVHGVSEAADAPSRIYGFVPGTTARDLLVAGRRLGFVGSTDGHDGHPGLSHLATGQGGLAAILTDDLTREGLATALRARHAYATNGARILLRVQVAGQPMGEALPAPEGPVPVDVRVVGTAGVRTVEIVQGADVVERWEGEGELAHLSLKLPAAKPGDFVYVRVTQVDGGLAWSSPVWFTD